MQISATVRPISSAGMRRRAGAGVAGMAAADMPPTVVAPGAVFQMKTPAPFCGRGREFSGTIAAQSISPASRAALWAASSAMVARSISRSISGFVMTSGGEMIIESFTARMKSPALMDAVRQASE